MAHPHAEARLIREHREQMGLSIREAARRADMSEGSWRSYESRKNVNRRPHTLARMAQIVGATPEALAAAGRPDAAAELGTLPAIPQAEPTVAELREQIARLEREWQELRGRLDDGRPKRGELGHARAASG